MKTIFISLLSLSLCAGSAFASDKANEKKSLPASAHSEAISNAVSNLTEENHRLRTQLTLLENQAAELQSAMAYQNLMVNMLGCIHSVQDKEDQQEREAENAYNKMMSNMLIALRDMQ